MLANLQILIVTCLAQSTCPTLPAMRHLIFISVCLLWGSNFILMKKAELVFGPISIGAWRVTLGSMILVIVWLVRKKARAKGWPIQWKHFLPLCFIVLISYIYPYTTQPYLIGTYGDSAFIGMMVALVPLATILASIVILRTWPTTRQVVGVIGGLIFFALVFYDGRTTRDMSIFHLALATAVPIGYALGNTYLKKHLAKLPTLPLTLAAMSLASIVLLPVSVATETADVHSEHFPFAIAALLIFGILGTGVATILFYSMIQRQGPLYASMVTYIIPIVALAWGTIDKEPLTASQLVGLIGILAMVALVQIKPK
jgi:drug/metabolite transporter (DMT)-like permease